MSQLSRFYCSCQHYSSLLLSLDGWVANVLMQSAQMPPPLALESLSNSSMLKAYTWEADSDFKSSVLLCFLGAAIAVEHVDGPAYSALVSIFFIISFHMEVFVPEVFAQFVAESDGHLDAIYNIFICFVGEVNEGRIKYISGERDICQCPHSIKEGVIDRL